jgi:hypothetical protein
MIQENQIKGNIIKKSTKNIKRKQNKIRKKFKSMTVRKIKNDNKRPL